MSNRIKKVTLLTAVLLLVVVFAYAYTNGGIAQTSTTKISLDSPVSFPVDI